MSLIVGNGWGYPPLARGVSTVRYPILKRIFDYVSTVRGATARAVREAEIEERSEWDRSPIATPVFNLLQIGGCAAFE